MRELTHTEEFAVHRIFIGHGEHLVVVEWTIQRYITQQRVEGILGGVELACENDLVVGSVAQAVEGWVVLKHIQHIRCLACSSIDGGNELLVEVIGTITRVWTHKITGDGGVVGCIFSQVHKSNHIAHVGIDLVAVRDPDLGAGNDDVRPDDGQGRHGLVVLTAEVIRQEKVPVHVVLVGRDIESCGLRPALYGHTLVLTTLLRQHRSHGHTAKLHFTFDTEQALAALDERAP